MVRSADPLANHWLSGSTANERTQPMCPLMTRITFQGACQSGRACLTVSFLTNALEGVPRVGVGPWAFGAAPFPDRSVKAIDCASLLFSIFSEDASIILRILGSVACSSAFAFLIFRLFSAAVEAAIAILAAKAGGNSCTWLYSWCILVETRGESMLIDGYSTASAPKTARVRLAEARATCSAIGRIERVGYEVFQVLKQTRTCRVSGCSDLCTGNCAVVVLRRVGNFLREAHASAFGAGHVSSGPDQKIENHPVNLIAPTLS